VYKSILLTYLPLQDKPLLKSGDSCMSRNNAKVTMSPHCITVSYR